MSELLKEITDEQFTQEVVESQIPVLVDFWAPWCQPCKAMMPVLEDVAKEFDGKLKIVKVNIDSDTAFAAENNVRSIPNFVIYKNGKKCEQFVGSKSKNDLIKLIEGVL